MGQLVNLNEIKDNAEWYFKDAYYASGRCVFSWPNPSFPYSVNIHYDDLKGNSGLKVEIRKWIETNLTETVIIETIDKSYRRYLSDDKKWESSYEVSNYWTAFYFEEEHAETMFRLRFSEYIKPITDEHPRWLK